MLGIRCALDSDRSLVILPVGSTPATVGLRAVHTHTAILVYAVVGRCLPGRICEQSTQALRTALAYNTVRSDPVNGMIPLTGLIGAEFGEDDQTIMWMCG